MPRWGSGTPAYRGTAYEVLEELDLTPLRWRDVPPSYGPHKTIYNCFIRCSEIGVFGRSFVEVAKGGGDIEEIMIDATHLKAHRTAASRLKKGHFPGLSGAQ